MAHLPRVSVAGISRDAPGKAFEQYTLSELELNFISSGLCASELNGQRILNAAGHVYSYVPGDILAGRCDPNKGVYVCRWVKFSWPGWRRDEVRKAGLVKLPRDIALDPQAQRQVQAAFDSLLDAHDSGQPGWQAGASGYLLALISLLLRESSGLGRGAQTAIDRRLSAACAFMEQNLARNMKVSEIAHAAQLADDYFSRLFRRQLGKSPLQHLIQLRIQEGRRLLIANPGMTIRESARRAGFPDTRHFSRSFARRFGMTPDEFRRKLTNRI